MKSKNDMAGNHHARPLPARQGSAGGSSGERALVSLVNISDNKLFALCSHLNKRISLPDIGLETEKSCNLLTRVRLGISGYTLDRIAPLVGVKAR